MKIVKKRTQKWLKMKSECIFWRFSVLGQILEDKSDQKKNRNRPQTKNARKQTDVKIQLYRGKGVT